MLMYYSSPGYDVKLHPPPLGLEAATAWVAELDGSHLHTDGLAS